MTAPDIERITQAVQNVEPLARLVPRRLIQRVIRRHFDLSPGAKAPHDLVFELPSALMQSLTGDPATGAGQNHVVLLSLPAEEEHLSTEQMLVDCWRKLFHAAIDRHLDQAGGSFADDRRLFNATILHEIRGVLESEHRLIPGADDRIFFREFAALYLELQFFAPKLVEVYFPGFLHPEEAAGFLHSRIDARALFSATRPEGATDPTTLSSGFSSPGSPENRGLTQKSIEANEAKQVRAKASVAAQIGNDVRAAICHAQLGEISNAEEKLRSLVRRLKQVLLFSACEEGNWYESLRPILAHATEQGFWDVGERLLYELQKACLDVERKSYSVDAIEWVVSFGRHPIKRLLEKPRLVNVLRRLRAATKHLNRLLVADDAKDRLDQLLHQSMHAIEQRVREENRPILHEVLDEVGIVAENHAERISRDKLVEELLDTLCTRGFLKMTDLRDALARSRVKLNNLSGPKELLLGDPIIRANRKLAFRLDGIYRRGEIYMRGLQRLSSIFFGTAIGRLLVLWFILPFTASFVVLFFIDELSHLLGGLFHWIEKIIVGTEPPTAEKHAESALTSPVVVGAFGLFLLAMIHAPPFRRFVTVWARRALFDVPSAIYHSSFVRGIFHNAATRFFIRYLLLPSLVGVTVVVLMRTLEFDWQATLLVGGGFALLTGTLFRTSFGRGLEERLDESLAEVWHVVSVNFLIGLLTLFLQFFRWVFEWMERAMYAVDEWLRFREGESKSMLVFKLLFGLGWFFVSYLFRFAWNLLIEPQINPIKHFPVVTVSHKLILPMSIPAGAGRPSPLAEMFMKVLGIPSDPADLAKTVHTMNAVAGGIVWGIPGIFGFLVWELKENWKLYKANRSPVIGPVSVGSHGERMRGLLRPGFHSGVVPKTFAKLRKAESVGNHKKAAKHHHHLEHVAEAVQRLVERELIAYLRGSRRWGGLPIHVQRIALATNRLRIALAINDWEGILVISIEERGGWLIGSIEQTGWLSNVGDKPRTAFQNALAELYKLCGVHVLREQAGAVLGVEVWRIDCRPEGLIVLPKSNEPLVEIDYTDAPTMTPAAPIDGRTLTPVDKCQLVLSDCPMRWEVWVECWEKEQGSLASESELLNTYRLM